MRILVAEDDYFLAHQLTTDIIRLGCGIVGPFAGVEDALLCDEPVDAAILDIRLGNETSFPIADSLRRAAIPFLFLTGHSRVDLPPRFADARVYRKPGHAVTLLADLSAQRRAQQPPRAPDSIEQVVAAMLVHARETLPDQKAAERLVMAVLEQALRGATQDWQTEEPKYWLFEMLRQEMRRWRLYLH